MENITNLNQKFVDKAEKYLGIKFLSNINGYYKVNLNSIDDSHFLVSKKVCKFFKTKYGYQMRILWDGFQDKAVWVPIYKIMNHKTTEVNDFLIKVFREEDKALLKELSKNFNMIISAKEYTNHFKLFFHDDAFEIFKKKATNDSSENVNSIEQESNEVNDVQEVNDNDVQDEATDSFDIDWD